MSYIYTLHKELGSLMLKQFQRPLCIPKFYVAQNFIQYLFACFSNSTSVSSSLYACHHSLNTECQQGKDGVAPDQGAFSEVSLPQGSLKGVFASGLFLTTL